MPWARKQSAIPTMKHAYKGQTGTTGLSRTDSSMFLDDRRIKESAGHEQSLLPLPDFSRKETLLAEYY